MDGQNQTAFLSGGVKGIIMLLGVLLSLFVAILTIGKAHDLILYFDQGKPENTFAVSGEGKVKAVPDTAIITLGVVAQGKDAKTAQEDAVKKINGITEFAKSLGVAKEDITTTQSSINPVYNYQNGRNEITGFESYQNVTVKIRGVDKNAETAGKIMSGAVEKGANSVQGSQFIIDDPENLKQEARKLAIAKAKEKAMELAREAGIELGKVVSISENGNGSLPPMMMYEGIGGGYGGGDAKAVPSPDIQVGTQEVIQNITLTFEVK